MKNKFITSLFALTIISQMAIYSNALNDEIEDKKINSITVENTNTQGNMDSNNKQNITLMNEKDRNESSTNSNESISFRRVFGNNRTDTSIAISKHTFEKADIAVIVDGSNYPDALSASSLTDGKYPILLVQNNLSDSVVSELYRLGVIKVIIVGGEKSVPKSIEEKLKTLDNIEEVERIHGFNRYDTNAKIFKMSKSNNLVVANGESFPDALASSSLLQNGNLILTNTYYMPDFTKDKLRNYKPKNTYIIGGINSISNSIYNSVETKVANSKISRVSGNNRYATSASIANKFTSNSVIVANGENFPDALAAAPLSQKLNQPIILVNKNGIDSDVQKYLINNNINKVILLGGEQSIPADIEKDLNTIITKKTMVEPKLTNTETKKKKDVSTLATKPNVDAVTDKKNTEKVAANKSNEGNIVVSEETVSLADSIKKRGKVVNHVPYISQLYPLYAPNGCEPTSLLMGLKGKGYTNIDLKSYLDAIPKTKTNPRYGYVGVPYNVEEHRFQTIDPAPLAKYGSRYGKVVNIQGASIDEIKKEIQDGNTVVVWVTLFWNKAFYKTLNVDGKPERRIWNNHAVLLTGYDPEKRMFYVADPYNHEKAGASRKRPFYYWKSEDVINRCYNYDNRRFALVVR